MLSHETGLPKTDFVLQHPIFPECRNPFIFPIELPTPVFPVLLHYLVLLSAV
jgi:hypothetical protein